MSEMTPRERAMKEAIRIVANPQRSAHAAADIIEAAITEAVSSAKAEMEEVVGQLMEAAEKLDDRSAGPYTLVKAAAFKQLAEAAAAARKKFGGGK